MTNRGWSSCLSWLLVGLVLLCASWAPVGAQTIQEAPMNPEFLRNTSRATTGGSLGYHPSPVDWSHLQGARLSTRTTFPATYDLRSLGKMTAVRNQSSSGSCWAFATFASMESCLLPGETTDYSENNLKNASGFDLEPNTGGGNRDMATAYLARWSGPVNETDDPYNPSSTTSPSLAARKHMQQVIYLPDRTAPTDNDVIKQAVMTYGAVMTLYYANNTYFKPETNAYYNPTTTSVNHAVAIVGWDDNFSAANFYNTPPGNGAFIVKNSWSSAWGNGGYFCMSYYEPTIRQNTIYYNAESVSNYSCCYQYDPLGLCSSMGYNSNTGWLANVFTAAGSDLISAVSTYAQKPGTTYQLSVYVNPTSGPIGGTPAVAQSGTFIDAGYHTVILASPVQVSPGQTFSVVMRLTTSGYNYPIPVERPYNGYSSLAVSVAGQSYVSSNGTSWSDIRSSINNANVCLKAFAIPANADFPLTAVGLSASLTSPQALGQSIRLTAAKTGGVSVQYRFSVSGNEGAAWTVLWDFSVTAAKDWMPEAMGSYWLKVAAREGTSGSPVDSPAVSYTITAFGLAPEMIWDVDLVARTGGESHQISLGETVGQAAYMNVEEPTGELFSFYLEQPGQPPLETDYRVHSLGQQQWQFVVKWDTDAATFTDVVITWPNAGKIPRGLALTLVDLATGVRRYMRTAGYFVIPAARGRSEQRFLVIATRESEVPLRILGLALEASRFTGVRISYTLTRGAEVTLTVRALSGRVVSRMTVPEPQAAGPNTILWDGRSTTGSRLPAGTYHLELLANDDENCRVRALTLVNMR